MARSTASFVLLLHALALASGCRASASPQQPSNLPPGPYDHTTSVQSCSATDPSHTLCEQPGTTCSGAVHCNWSCPQGPGTCPPPRCGMHRWRCQCTADAHGAPRWDCDVEMHPAGPLPPPELALG